METLKLTLTEKEEIRNKTAKPMLWLAIVSMIMLFAGLTSAYVVRIGQGNWVTFDIPVPFYLSTGLILISSVTMNIAKNAIKAGDAVKLTRFLALTFLLGLGFIISQFYGWKALVSNKIFFAGTQSNASGSFLYTLSGLHLAHLFGGLLFLLAVLVKSARYKYSENNYLGVQLASIYWHFLDILWIYLFLFLVFIR
jgi:cytochrome c oxidase subunit III